MLCATDIAKRHGAMLPALPLSAVFHCVGAFALPAFNSVKEPFGLIPIVERTVPADGRLLLFGIDGESLSLHSNRRGKRLDDDDALRSAMFAEGSGLAVFLAQDATNLVERFSPQMRETGHVAMGKKTYVWMSFGESPSMSSPLNERDNP